MWSTPKEWDTAGGQLGHLAVKGTPVDNKVWIKNSDGTAIYRLDLVTNKFENLGTPKDPRTGRRIGTYGIHSDEQNNAYLLDFAAGNIVKIDAKTKQETVYLTPTSNSTPRRGRVDDAGSRVVRGVSRHGYRHARSEDRQDPGVEGAVAVERAL